MKSVFVVFSRRSHPIVISFPRAVISFATRKEAEAFADLKNNHPNSHQYYVLRVPFRSNHEQ